MRWFCFEYYMFLSLWPVCQGNRGIRMDGFNFWMNALRFLKNIVLCNIWAFKHCTQQFLGFTEYFEFSTSYNTEHLMNATVMYHWLFLIAHIFPPKYLSSYTDAPFHIRKTLFTSTYMWNSNDKFNNLFWLLLKNTRGHYKEFSWIIQ